MIVEEPTTYNGSLAYDLAVVEQRTSERRRMLRCIVASGATVWMALRASLYIGRAGDDRSRANDSGAIHGGRPMGGRCEEAPEETAGPFPADGSGRGRDRLSNVLSSSGIVRRDIRSSFGASSSVAQGLPLRLSIRLQDPNRSCAPLANHAIYLWHCNRDGAYSLYSRGLENENYLRGVQFADDDGQATFQTVFPACYPGRYPHIHIEIFSSRSPVGGYRNRILTSQLLLPRSVCETVYKKAMGYGASATTLAGIDVSTDNVFSRSTATQLAAQTPSVAGHVTTGYTAAVRIGVGRTRNRDFSRGA